jgi:hypothetical protein
MFPLEDFIFHMNFKQSFYGMRALSTGVVLELPLCEVRELVSCNTHCRYEEAVLMFEGEFHKKWCLGGKLLGLPIGANHRQESTWKPVIESLKRKLSVWTGKHLYFGGRIMLINSVLASLPLYFF